MSTAPNAPHRDAADWRVLILELNDEFCSNELIAECVGAKPSRIEAWRTGEVKVPASRFRAALIGMAYDELDDAALNRALVTAPMPERVAACRRLAGTDDDGRTVR